MKVGNIRTYKGNAGILVDRSTIVGNPFRIGPDGDRDEVVDKYRPWFANAMRTNPDVKRFIGILVDAELHCDEEITLLCWCHPLRCHVEVIIEEVQRQVKDILEEMRAWDGG